MKLAVGKLIAASLMASAMTTGLCWAGIDSGGGDAAEAEFVAIGQGLSLRLKGDLGSRFGEVDPAGFERVVQSTKVIMTSLQLEENGVPRDALNYPTQGKIEVNRPSWIKLSPTAKVGLVFHEYLGIQGVERGSYAVSSRLPSILGQDGVLKLATEASPNADYKCELIRLNPEDARIQEHCDGGAYFVLTTRHTDRAAVEQNPFTPANDHFSQICGGIWISLTKGISLTGDVNFNVQMSKLERGPESKWQTRDPDQYAAFRGSLYSPPQSFALNLTLRNRSLISKRKTTYYVACEQK